MKPYEILSRTDKDGFYFIELTEGEFKGIIYSLGGVEIIEEADQARLKFEYEIEDKEDYPNLDVPAFEQYIGGILTDLIEESLAQHKLVYKGGVDEN
jgi:hypothetical protein